MIFYTADLHFGHTSVLRMSNRPFTSIEEHDNFLIKVWNETVTDSDDIYIVGGLAYKNKENVENYLKRLKGKKQLILGNHDLHFRNRADSNHKYFESIEQITMIKDGKFNVVLCHYPMVEWSEYFRGAYNVHGHIHNNTDNSAFQFLRTQDRALNAGVDINNFKPVTIQELIVNNKLFKESH